MTWHVEKAESLVRGLTRMVDETRRREDLPPDYRELLDLEMLVILNDATKLLAAAVDGEWDTQDAPTIVAAGIAGYERVLVRYGMLTETADDRYTRLLDSIHLLLGGPRATSRTDVHTQLDAHPGHEPGIERLRVLIEEVTLGNMDWADFCAAAGGHIEGLRSNMGAP